jgi:branched-subunit amino acid aminotransferase/4-amino-4-deoxychorismate lyase
MTSVVFLDGSFISAEKARLPVLSRAVLYGEGLFETLRTYEGRPFALDEHCARLEESARTLAIPLPANLLSVEHAIPRLLSRNGLSDAVVRISILAGQSVDGLAAISSRSHLLIAVRGIPASLEGERRRGVAAVTLNAGVLPLAAHKTTSYLRSIAALRGNAGVGRIAAVRGQAGARETAGARRPPGAHEPAGAREVLFVDTAGRILEGATSNVFALFGNLIVTPPADGRILPGVTRQIVMDIAEKAGMKIRQKPLGTKNAGEADGMFITNSVIELLPVVTLDGKAVGKGRPHPLTKVLHGLYQERVRQA